MTVVWDKEYLIKLTEEGLPGAAVTSNGSEAKRKWRGNEVILTFSGGMERASMVRPDGTALIVNSALDRALTKVRVRRLGPDAMPCEWIVTPKQALSTIKPGSTLDVSIRARLRHSGWIAGSTLFKSADRIQANTTPVFTLQDDALDALATTVDDISFLETVSFSRFATSKVGWHNEYMRGFQNFIDDPTTAKHEPIDTSYRENACVAYSKAVLAAAHQRGLQILAGYEMVGLGGTNSKDGDAFVAWIAAKTTTIADIRAHADEIYKFLWTDRGLDFDGISFDIELAGLLTHNADGAARMGALFGRMAELLAPDNRLVAYATAPFKTDGVTGANTQHLACMPYRLAAEHPNVIARPMAYDGGEGIHPETIACALDQVGLHPSQFQIGVKLTTNLFLGQSGVLLSAEVRKRCKELYAPNRVGLCGFALERGHSFMVPNGAPAGQPKDVTINGKTTTKQNAADPAPAGAETFYAELNPGLTRKAESGFPLQAPLRSAAT